MRRRGRALLGVGLPILTILVFIMLLAFSLMRLSEIERDMRIEATQNMLWVISRAHISSLHLAEAARSQRDGDTDRAQLERRYNVFLSRLALLADGPQRRRMERLGFAAELSRIEERLPQISELVTASERSGLQQLPALLEPYNNMLGHAANKAMVAEWDDLGNTLDVSRAQLWQIITSLIGISLAGTVLCGHFILTIRDARRRARLLDKENAFSELLIGSSGEGIVAVDHKYHCTVWNGAAERLFEHPSSEALGHSLGTISGFFDVDSVRAAIRAALDGQPAALFDQPFFPPGRDTVLYLDLRCFSLRDEARIIGAIVLISDVTERRAAQKEIADHRDHLEQLVEARTQELDAALKRERASAELYRNFGTMVSHQFRTPLAIVDSALQRLVRRRHELTPEEVLERCSYARHSIARLTGLVASTLDAARLDAGQIEIRSAPCDLSETVMDVCARQTEQTPERVISLEIPEEFHAIACCDPFHAEHILINLVSNAIKYSPQGTTVTIALSSSNNHQIECTILNQGSLDDPAEPEVLFERYYRGSNAKGLPGIGVGLYMARTLARLQGGDLRVQFSEPSMVSFTLVLPRVGSLSDVSSIAHVRKELT